MNLVAKHLSSVKNSRKNFSLQLYKPFHVYNHVEIEKKWQDLWDKNKNFKAIRRANNKKKYVLDMFPYPSGTGLHVGHPEGYTASDIMARYWRMKGFDVLHPMGWDAFGLPAEQHAMNTGTHPSITTYDNIATFKRQLKSLGFSYDWDREFSTTDDQYVRWTQWIFLQLFNRGLACQTELDVNWCPKLGTVLSNEEVVNGLSERGNHPVVRQPIRQWVLKITEYADRLEKDLDQLVGQWPAGTLASQKQWIGRSEGTKIKFQLQKNFMLNTTSSVCDDYLEVFTTQPHTLMGVTFLAISPDHPSLLKITDPSQLNAVNRYMNEAKKKTDLDRVSSRTKKSNWCIFRDLRQTSISRQ